MLNSEFIIILFFLVIYIIYINNKKSLKYSKYIFIIINKCILLISIFKSIKKYIKNKKSFLHLKINKKSPKIILNISL